MDNESDDNGVSRSQQTNNADAEPMETNANLKNKSPPVEHNEENDLKDALENGNIDDIDKILDNNPSLVNSPWITPLKETPLHFATRREREDVVLHLLKRSDIHESVNKADCDGFLPLHRALISNEWDDEIVLEALTRKMTVRGVNSKNKDNDTVFHYAAKAHRLDVIQRLCTFLPEVDIDSKNKAGRTPIQEGIGSWEVVECLLRHGASRVVNEHSDTLLHAAVALKPVCEGFETGRALLEEGIDLAAENSDKNTPVHLVASNLNRGDDKHDQMLMALRELLGLIRQERYHERTRSSLVNALGKQNNAGDTALHIIVSRRIYDDTSLRQQRLKEVVMKIVSVYPDALILEDENNNSPLHKACLVDNHAMVEALLQADRELRPKAHDIANCVNGAGDMPLHLAARRGNEPILELLLFHGADRQKTDKKNLVAADVARRANLIAIADFIFQYRPRNFQLELERVDDGTKKVDDYFLALIWPDWDKTVRQRRGEPPRMWPHIETVHEMIFNASDPPCFSPEDYVKETLDSQTSGVAIDLAPIHQAQIRLASCGNKGWIMKEGLNRRQRLQTRERHEKRLQNNGGQLLEQLEIQNNKRLLMDDHNRIYLYDSMMFQGNKRSTRWIHLPANNVRTTMTLLLSHRV